MVRKALKQGEVERLRHKQATTGDTGGIYVKRHLPNSLSCMSDGDTRRMKWTDVDNPAEAEETALAETLEAKAVVTCQSLPPLGPVVRTAHTQGEVEGQHQEQDSTGDSNRNLETNETYFCIKWRKRCQKLRRKCKQIYEAASRRGRPAVKSRGALSISDIVTKVKEIDMGKELVRGSRRKTGIG